MNRFLLLSGTAGLAMSAAAVLAQDIPQGSQYPQAGSGRISTSTPTPARAPSSPASRGGDQDLQRAMDAPANRFGEYRRAPVRASRTGQGNEYDDIVHTEARNDELAPRNDPNVNRHGVRTGQSGPEWLRDMNAEQAERFTDAARQGGNRTIDQMSQAIPDANQYFQTHGDQIVEDAGPLIRTYDPAQRNAPGRQEMINDPAYARNLANSTVDTVRNTVQLEIELGRVVRPVLTEGMRNNEPMLREMEAVARQNGASPQEIRDIQQSVRDVNGRIPVAAERIASQHDTDVRRAMTNLNDNRQRIADQLTPIIEQNIRQYGDPINWPPEARARVNDALPTTPPPIYTRAADNLGVRTPASIRAASDAATRATSPAVVSPSPAPPAQPPAVASGSTRPTTSSTTHTASRGTIPQADPQAAYRVPQSQGGTGVDDRPPPPSSTPPSSTTRRVASNTAPARPNAPPPPVLPPRIQIDLPRDRNVPEGRPSTSDDVSFGRTPRPSDRQTSSQGNGGSGTPARSAGASAAGTLLRETAEDTFGGTGPTPRRATTATTIGGRNLEADIDNALRAAERGRQPSRPINASDRNAILRVLDNIPRNQDGSINTTGMYAGVRDTFGRLRDYLFSANTVADQVAGGLTPEQQMARDRRLDDEAMQRLERLAALRARAEAEANERPRPLPTSPSYPTHVRTADERAAYDRRRANEAFRAASTREAALARAEEEARAAAAAVARREAARVADEQRRLTAAATARTARDGAWNAMVNERFNSGQVWEDFRNGGTLTALALEPIYRDYNPLNSIPPAQSLSAAPNSLSTVGFDPRSFGIPLIRGTLDFNDPAVQSLNEVLYGPLTNRRGNPFDQTRGLSNAQIADASYSAGSFAVQADPTGRWGRETGGYIAASLLDQGGYLRSTTANGLGGLDALLAQPFNVVLTWGSGAFDLDLHMTGPLGRQTPDRFHIYYAAAGDLTAQPFAALIKDCICRSGSEVILTSALNGGGVYRVSVFNFGDQSATSTNLANASQATIQIVRGGTTQSVGNGTTIVGGRVLLTTTAPNGQPGNTWIAAEINPTNGRITVPRAVVQSESDRNVR